MKRTLTKIDKIPPEYRKQKVAVYCGVSTDRDAQLISLDNQKSHYERLTSVIGNWELADYYLEAILPGNSPIYMRTRASQALIQKNVKISIE